MVELTETEYTQYGVHKVLNKILVANGRSKIQPQRMYNYAANGMLVEGEKITGTTLRKLTVDEVADFLIRYCVRNHIEIKFNQVVSPAQLELPLEVESTN
jgi:hypothetical protein